MPVLETACAPFTEGRWLFSHNGAVAGWPGSLAGLARTLPVTDLMTSEAPTDSALLWALVRHRLRAGRPLPDALAEVTVLAGAAAPGSRLNLLATDGDVVAATTWGHALCVRRAADSVVVSSEATDPDDAGWRPVADRQLVVAGRTDLSITPLPGGSS
jgi:glutamine amidotransferase